MTSDGIIAASPPAVARGESRWPPAIAVAVAIVLQLRVPKAFAIGPRYVVPGAASLLLIALIAVHPKRFGRDHHRMRRVSMALIAAISAGNATSLGLLIHRLLNGGIITGGKIDGHRLILAGSEIWLTSVIAFGLWFWELDRGGPAHRARGEDQAPDLLFVQMTDDRLLSTNWRPSLVDYFYVSVTNSTAFSPTDTLPLSSRMKALMAVQALASLATIGIVGARAVNILS